MLPGFEKIVEERIQKAIRDGEFDNLEGAGKPIAKDDDVYVPEELKLAYKILKNANCLPPEIEIKKEIHQTEELLNGMEDTAEKYRTVKKLNFLIMKLNSLRKTSVLLEMPQYYSDKLVERLDANKSKQKGTLK